MSPARHEPKTKILLDEGLPPRRSFSKLSDYCDVKHVAQDLGMGGATDAQVYGYACSNERLLIVFNEKHFRPLVRVGGMSVIAISPDFNNEQMDAKILSKIKSLKPSDYSSKFFRITR